MSEWTLCKEASVGCVPHHRWQSQFQRTLTIFLKNDSDKPNSQMRESASLEAVSNCWHSSMWHLYMHCDRADNINFHMANDNLFSRVLWWEEKNTAGCVITHITSKLCPHLVLADHQIRKVSQILDRIHFQSISKVWGRTWTYGWCFRNAIITLSITTNFLSTGIMRGSRPQQWDDHL